MKARLYEYSDYGSGWKLIKTIKLVNRISVIIKRPTLSQEIHREKDGLPSTRVFVFAGEENKYGSPAFPQSIEPEDKEFLRFEERKHICITKDTPNHE